MRLFRSSLRTTITVSATQLRRQTALFFFFPFPLVKGLDEFVSELTCLVADSLFSSTEKVDAHLDFTVVRRLADLC